MFDVQQKSLNNLYFDRDLKQSYPIPYSPFFRSIIQLKHLFGANLYDIYIYGEKVFTFSRIVFG